VNASIGESLFRSVTVVQQGVDRSVRPQRSDRCEGAFRTAHHEEIVVYQRYGREASRPQVPFNRSSG
jgi:hypothetical protein